MKATTYNPETGAFGYALDGDLASILENVPEGWSWVPGHYLADTQRVERVVVDDFGDRVPIIVSCIPAAPPDTEWVTWSWDPAALQWVSTWTTQSRAVLKRRERDHLLASTDWIKQRADERGETVSSEWLAWRAALRDAPLDPAWPDITFPPQPTP